MWQKKMRGDQAITTQNLVVAFFVVRIQKKNVVLNITPALAA